jgi:uncharacterized membrane protein
MKQRLFTLRDTLRSNYWFIPLVTAVFGILLSILTIKLDERVGRNLAWVTGLVYVDSPEGARAVLSVIAGSMITVAGVVFSLTMVALTLTAQQYGSLVLSNFLRDRGNQFVLGVFTATFIFCLLVLRTIRGVESSAFVPHISVLVGIGLAIASLGVLTYFIHDVSNSLRASTIVARVSDDLIETIEYMFPLQENGVIREEGSLPEHFDSESQPLRAPESGYLQYIDYEYLLSVTQNSHTIVEIKYHPGQFLIKGAVVGTIWPSEQVDQRLLKQVGESLVIGDQRTQSQDVEFLIDQLVAMAVRALSPAINDPFTAMMVIDRLGEALCLLAAREMVSPFVMDKNKQVRIVTHPVTFDSMIKSAFDQIRHYGKDNIKVMIRLLRTLVIVRDCAADEERKDILSRYTDQVWEEARTHLPIENPQ